VNHPDHHNDSYEDDSDYLAEIRAWPMRVEELSRDDVLEIAANHSLEEMGAEIFARLDISEWDLLLAEAQDA
jgi:hypothetical protein